MAADLTIYCLQQVTDYSEFERLCHDIMSLVGYGSIEPLGGFKDKGRDAIHTSPSEGVTLFAYSVREDWRAKLAEDAGKIFKHGHACNKLVFVTTSEISAGERDEAVESIASQYHWQLELYSLERLRNLLDIQFPHIKSNHLQIFPPTFLAIQDQLLKTEQRDHILINYALEDTPLAEWLARKLVAEGYLVWSKSFPLFAGEKYPDDIVDALNRRVAHVVAIYSVASLDDQELVYQRAVAQGLDKQIGNFFIPIRVEQLPIERLDRATLSLIFTSFEKNLAEGLGLLLAKLNDLNCPKILPNGKEIASRLFVGKEILSNNAELVVSNYFSIKKLPEHIQRFSPASPIERDLLEKLKLEWSFREISDKMFVSFQSPPKSVIEAYGFKPVGKGSWRDTERIEGVDTDNLIAELVRKGLAVKCLQKGLKYCDETRLFYFPIGLIDSEKIRYLWPNGKTASINVTGERKYRPSKVGERYRYYLAPDFYVSQTLDEDFGVLLRVRVRITDITGVPLPSKRANSRRKDLCHDWWNGEWLSRLLAICQYLSDNNQIIIGASKLEQIIINAEPKRMVSAQGIREENLDVTSYEREDIIFSEDELEEDLLAGSDS